MYTDFYRAEHPQSGPSFAVHNIYRLMADHTYQVDHSAREIGRQVFVYTDRGQGKMYCKEGEFTLEAGTALLFSADAPFSYHTVGNQWHFWWFDFDGGVPLGESYCGEAVCGETISGEAVCGEAISGKAVCGEAISGEAVCGEAVCGEAIFGKAVCGEMFCRKGRLYSVQGKEWLGEICAQALKALREESASPGAYLSCLLAFTAESGREETDPGRELFSRAQLLIKENGYRNSVSSIARKLGVSQKTLYNLFRRYGGCSPQAYLRNDVMDMSRYLLRNTTKSIGEIAEEMGFANQFHFSRVFKETCGVSPREYRQQSQN